MRNAVSCAGTSHPVEIEPKVFDVLVYLLEHRDRVVTKEELLEHCWTGTFVSEAALTRCLAKVRKVVEPEPARIAGHPDALWPRLSLCGSSHGTAARTRPAVAALRHLTPPGAPRRSKILIVDDEPFNVDYLEQALADLGYETLNAANSQEALAKVAADAPDLILLDVMMPVMDGFTVCRLLKRRTRRG